MVSFSDVPVSCVQAYWDHRPCNIRHSREPVGTRAYFDQVEARKYLVEPHIPRFADFAAWRGKRVLEVGCGIGTDTINFARAGAQVTAVDLSETSLALARRRAEVFSLTDRITFMRANAEDLSASVPVEPYDLVYSFGVIHHSPEPERVLAQVRRYMGADGTLKLMVYHSVSTKVAWIVAAQGRGRCWNVGALVARHSEAQTCCPVTYTYTRGEARRLVEKHGFVVASLAVDHIFPYRIADYVEYRHVREWYYRMLPTLVFRGLERRFGWHLLVTARPA